MTRAHRVTKHVTSLRADFKQHITSKNVIRLQECNTATGFVVLRVNVFRVKSVVEFRMELSVNHHE
jgi:hypothetical protein